VDVLGSLQRLSELAPWKQVPELVRTRYKEASAIQRDVTRLVKALPAMASGYGHVYWNPKEKSLWGVVGDSDEVQDVQRFENALNAVHGVANVRVESEHGPFDDPNWIRIKRSSALSWLNEPYRVAGSLLSGPSPLSNSIVSGLLGSGAGYTVGTVAENMLPERYVERGKLRRNLAMLGGAAGVAAHVPAAMANAQMNRKATGDPHWQRSIMGSDADQQLAPNESDWQNHYQAGHFKQSVAARLELAKKHLPIPAESTLRMIEEFTKKASGYMTMDSDVLRPVPVDAFNNAIWNDVHNGVHSSQSNPYGTRSPYGDNSESFRTPAINAAAAVGLVTGVQQMYGGSSVLSPKHFVKGLAAAGVDAATAHIAGGVLGALGGLTPEAQQQLQQMGLWSGMIRGVTSSVLGL